MLVLADVGEKGSERERQPGDGERRTGGEASGGRIGLVGKQASLMQVRAARAGRHQIVSWVCAGNIAGGPYWVFSLV